MATTYMTATHMSSASAPTMSATAAMCCYSEQWLAD
jgi:hypothetical protein